MLQRNWNARKAKSWPVFWSWREKNLWLCITANSRLLTRAFYTRGRLSSSHFHVTQTVISTRFWSWEARDFSPIVETVSCNHWKVLLLWIFFYRCPFKYRNVQTVHNSIKDSGHLSQEDTTWWGMIIGEESRPYTIWDMVRNATVELSPRQAIRERIEESKDCKRPLVCSRLSISAD